MENMVWKESKYEVKPWNKTVSHGDILVFDKPDMFRMVVVDFENSPDPLKFALAVQDIVQNMPVYHSAFFMSAGLLLDWLILQGPWKKLVWIENEEN